MFQYKAKEKIYRHIMNDVTQSTESRFCKTRIKFLIGNKKTNNSDFLFDKLINKNPINICIFESK